MGRFVTDLVRGHPPTALTVFYDGAAPAQAARAARYRRDAPAARRDLLWRDLSRFPEALSLFGLSRPSAGTGLAVVDRYGRLRIGLDARIALWRELPRYRWRSLVLDLIGVAPLLERPVTPRNAPPSKIAARAAALIPPRHRPASSLPL